MILRNNPLDRLERRFRWLAIPNLMLIIVGAMAIVFIMDFAIGNTTGRSLISILSFDRDAIRAAGHPDIVVTVFPGTLEGQRLLDMRAPGEVARGERVCVVGSTPGQA